MIRKTIDATSRGNQPPSAILARFAPRNATSGIRKAMVTNDANATLHRRRSRATTYARIVVMIIVVLTARPYAPARLVELRKPITSAIVQNISAQLTDGM